MHISVLERCTSMPRWRCSVEQRLCWCSRMSINSLLSVSPKRLHEGPQNCYNYDRVRQRYFDSEGAHPVARIHFCNLFLWSVQNGEFDPQCFSLVRPVLIMWRGEFSDQSVLECRKSRTCSWTPFHDEKNWCFVSGQELQRVTNPYLKMVLAV